MNFPSVDRLTEVIKRYDGWAYRPTGRPAYVAPPVPPWWPAASVYKAGREQQTDCSTFTGGVMAAAFMGFRWSDGDAGRLVVANGLHPWSNTDAAILAGCGYRVDAPVAGYWHLVQAWNGLFGSGAAQTVGHLSRGHSWFWLKEADGTEWIAEASSAVGRVQRVRRTWVQQAEKYETIRIVKLGA